MSQKDEKDTAKNKAIREFIADNKPTAPGDKELVIRTGEAEKILYPSKVAVKGVISAPAEFYKKRKELHDPNKCHVVFDKNAGTIKLVVDEQYPDRNYTVEGSISKNPDFAAFKINENYMFSVKELMQVLKFNRVHFVDKDVCNKIVTNLQNFKARIDKTIQDSSNMRGQDVNSTITKLEHELQESFVLKMPLFRGTEPKSFKVEICVTATDGAVEVWLESRELKEMQDGDRVGLIDAQLQEFTDIVCIQQ